MYRDRFWKMNDKDDVDVLFPLYCNAAFHGLKNGPEGFMPPRGHWKTFGYNAKELRLAEGQPFVSYLC